MIYLDNAATTKMRKECLEEIEKFSVKCFYNPSALYKPALEAAKSLKEARRTLLELLGDTNGGLIFTASGTEADNLALFCALKRKSGKIVVSEGEHAAVYNSALELRNRGYNVVCAPVKEDGGVDMGTLEGLIDAETDLVSVMHVSNETGAVNPLSEIAGIIKRKSPHALFHSDGVQAFGKIPFNIKDLGVDMYSISGHKLHGPKGVGALYVKAGVNLKPVIYGGGQEGGVRSATENLAYIMAMKRAAELAYQNFEKRTAKLKALKGLYFDLLTKSIDNIKLISSKEGAPHILTAAFYGVRGEVLLHALEKHGILVGIGSACSSKKHSRFERLLNLPEKWREGIVRISLSEDNNEEEAGFVVEKIKEEYELLKSIGRI
jgi:cysteine desulfurase